MRYWGKFRHNSAFTFILFCITHFISFYFILLNSVSYPVNVSVSDIATLSSCQSPSVNLLLSYPVSFCQWHWYSLILSVSTSDTDNILSCQSPSVTLLPSYPVNISVSDTATLLPCQRLRQWHCFILILSLSLSAYLLISYPVTVSFSESTTLLSCLFSVSDTATLSYCHCRRQWHCYSLILSLSPSVTLLLSYPLTVLCQWHCYTFTLSLSPSVTLLISHTVTVAVSDTATLSYCHCRRQWHCYSPILSLFSVSDTATLVQLEPDPTHQPLHWVLTSQHPVEWRCVPRSHSWPSPWKHQTRQQLSPPQQTFPRRYQWKIHTQIYIHATFAHRFQSTFERFFHVTSVSYQFKYIIDKLLQLNGNFFHPQTYAGSVLLKICSKFPSTQ